MKDKNIFQRVEKKYMLNGCQYQEFVGRTKDYIAPDDYGLHTISNIYYDTENYELIRNSIGKPKFKEKLRTRAYGRVTEDSIVFLEIKKKYEGIVYKRRTAMPFREANEFLISGKTDHEDQIAREIEYFLWFYKPEPKLFLAYDRIAYTGIQGDDIRVTVDQRIRSRNTELSLASGSEGELLLDEDAYLMEIKVPLAYPMWLASVLSELQIYPISFSKYGAVYKNAVVNKEIDFTFALAQEKLMRKKEEVPLCLQAY